MSRREFNSFLAYFSKNVIIQFLFSVMMTVPSHHTVVSLVIFIYFWWKKRIMLFKIFWDEFSLEVIWPKYLDTSVLFSSFIFFLTVFRQPLSELLTPSSSTYSTPFIKNLTSVLLMFRRPAELNHKARLETYFRIDFGVLTRPIAYCNDVIVYKVVA